MSLKPPGAGNSPITLTNVLNVQDFGARGDSSTNDTAAFLRAQQELGANGGTIFVPPGKYILDADALSFLDGRSVQLVGSGGVTAGASMATDLHIRNNGTFGLRIGGMIGFMLRDLVITYDSSFTGDLVQICQSPGLGAVPQMVDFHDFMLGDGGSGLAACLVNLLGAVNVSFSGEWTMHGATRAVKGTVVGAASGTNYSNAVRFIGGRLKTKLAPVLNPGFLWTFVGTTFQQCVGGITDPVNGGTMAAGAAGGIIAETGIPAANVTMVGCGFWDSTLASGGKWVDLSRTPVSNTASSTHAFMFLGGLASNADVQFDLTGCRPAVVEGVQWGSSNTRRVTYGRFGGNRVSGGDALLDSVNLDGQINFTGTTNQYIANQLMSAASTMMLSRISGDAQDRFALENTGRMTYGAGAIARDSATARAGTGLWGTETGTALTVGTATAAGTGYVQMFEQTVDPAAPAANGAKLFAKDSGGGKTQLCVRFPSGATQVIATEP